MRPAPPHSVRAHVAIARELVRLSLGGRPERPELANPIRDDRTQIKRDRKDKR
jgi:hypothetical protein